MSLTRIINKTPLVNERSNVYEIELIDSSLLSNIIQSRFIGDGVFGLEQYSISDYKEQYLFTPSFDKHPLPPSHKEWSFKEDIKEMTIYELVLDKSMFMPLDTKQFIDIFNTISEIKYASVFTQVLLCKRLDNWRETVISMYEQYLNGTDFPMVSKLSMKIQEKMLSVLNKISNYTVKRDRIEEMEQKILQNNYRFECRFVIYEEKYVNNFVSEMEKNLQKLQLFNEFSLKKVQNKRNFIKCIENREFQSDLVNQLLSEQEVYSLLSSEQIGVQKVELEKPIRQQGVLRNLEDSMLLQKATQLMPFGEKKSVEVDQSKAQQINQSFKRVNIVQKPLKISEIHQGSTLLKVQMVIPPEITYTSITKKLTDIRAAMGNEGVSLEIGDKPDTINVFVPLEERGVVYFRNLLESEEFQEFKKNHPLPFIVGESVNGETMFACLSKLRHILIAGATGSGKSVFLNLIIISLLLTVPSDELSLYLIDPKKIELTNFDGFPQVRKIITDMKKASELLASLCVEMENRYDKFSKIGSTCKELATYNQKSNEKIPYIVCVIDEFADLIMVNKAVEEYIVRLGQKARAAGIHLVIATQRPSVDVITGLIKANLPNRFAFAVSSQIDSRTIIDKGGAEKLLGRGDGLAMIEGTKKDFERFQSPLLTLDTIEEGEIYEKLKKLFDGIEGTVDNLLEIKVDEPIEQLKRIIADTGELRVSELGRLMEIGNNKIHALMIELLSEEWLKKEGRSYEINVDDEELNKWRDDK